MKGENDNNTLLKDKDYIQMSKNTIMEVKRTYSIEPNVNNLTEENIQFNINDQLFLETLLMTSPHTSTIVQFVDRFLIIWTPF